MDSRSFDLEFQLKLANMNTPTNFPFIKAYNLKLDWLMNQYDSLDADIVRNARLCRVRPILVPMGVVGEVEAPFFSAAEPNSIETLTGLGPFISQLPGEIRNIIYSYLLSTGHPQFLRASKAMYGEGSGLMAENGVYRMSFGTSNKINYLLPSQRIVDNIHNVDICANVSFSEGPDWMVLEPQNLWLLEAFGEPGRPRGQCSVTLDVFPTAHRLPLAGFCGHLTLFSGFETVVVRANVNWPEPDPLTGCPSDSMMDRAGKAWLEQRETAALRWSVFVCRFVYNLDELVKLKWYLGDSVLEGQDEMSFRLVFHPRMAQEKLTLAYEAATRVE